MKKILITTLTLLCPWICFAGQTNNILQLKNSAALQYILLLAGTAILVLYILKLTKTLRNNIAKQKKWLSKNKDTRYKHYVNTMSAQQIEQVLKHRRQTGNHTNKNTGKILNLLFILLMFAPNLTFSQQTDAPQQSNLTQPGIIITILLILVPIFLGSAFAIIKAIQAFNNYNNNEKLTEAKKFAEYLTNQDDNSFNQELSKRKEALSYTLSDDELAGSNNPYDDRGIITNVNNEDHFHFTAPKKKAVPKPSLEPGITRLIKWYVACAAFWLVLGSLIGEYVGIKFVAPDSDHVSWLSFGRLRPVHTNMVFWGWASLGIIGLGYYVVSTVSNTKIHSLKWGWISLWLINTMVIIGSLSLMAGINNGGGEFREYIWPITSLFAVALILTACNFFKTIAARKTHEIYISNWYILSSVLFTIVIALTAYIPFWQNGIGETIIQGYYMHSGVGMWFTLYTLGLLYYFIPQQLNKPIYSYSLGVLAFWTQILFYTIIGTHHFVFSAIPWWLQTVAIVGSAGMIIPVTAATINYYMTFKGQWKKISKSYTLPFFFVAVMYYFIVSMQGTAEAFKFTNQVWHFTDFTVGHSHLGFYGIISFAIWGGVYTIMPRLTGNEPPQHSVGAHFWLAFVGLIFYAIPLSIGGTLKGMMWMEHKPFIDSVVMMFDYWLWRAIGGSLMFLSHLVFAYNLYKMWRRKSQTIDVNEEAINQMKLLTGN